MSLPFLERLLQVLGQGGFSATYKYAVLLGMIDLCLEAGEPPTSVTTAQLARRVAELYWPQVRPWEGTVVLRQNAGKQADIATLLAEFRHSRPDLVSPPVADPQWLEVLDAIEWILIEYPLPRVQRVGGVEERFLYVIGWGEGVPRGPFRDYKRGDGHAFDNRILFQPGAPEALIALASVLRPLVQQQWLAKVRALNDLDESRLEEFLFGTDRARLTALQRPLKRLQEGRCFYCDAAFTGPPQVDHFLPWSRYPDDGLDNLVLAHAGCNAKKLHFLADLDFASAWEVRSRARSDALDAIATEVAWPRDRRRTFGIVAGVYRGLPDGVRLWAGGDRFRRVELADLPRLSTFSRGLLAV